MERLFEGASAIRLDGAALVDESFLADSCAMADSRFDAVAFAENVPLRDWASVFPNGRRSTHDVRAPLDGDGEVFAYPFGALVFRDVSAARREEVLAKVRQGFPQLSPPPIWEQFTVREDPAAKPGMAGGRSCSIGSPKTVRASSRIPWRKAQLWNTTNGSSKLVDRLERSGTVSLRTRPLHRFIGAAVSARNEVLAVLYLLD